MKKLSLFIALSIGLIFTSCQFVPKSIVASGHFVSRVENYKDFSAIRVGHALDLYVMSSSVDSIRLEGSDNLLAHVTCKMKGDELRFGLDTPFLNFVNNDVKIYIGVKMLNKLSASGASHIIVHSLLKTDDLSLGCSGASSLHFDSVLVKYMDVQISGASHVDATVSADKINAKVSGASSLTLNGTVMNFDSELSGASNGYCDALEVENLNVGLSGATSMKVDAKHINVDASGASHLYYKNGAEFSKKELSGASSVDSF